MVKKVKSKAASGSKKRGLKLKAGVKVQSASQLGVAASKLGIRQKAKTHRGRKFLEHKSAKIVENDKRFIIMKGRKGSEVINDVLKDLNMLRDKSMNQMLVKHTHDVMPMDDPSLIENQAVKYDCSLFALGSD